MKHKITLTNEFDKQLQGSDRLQVWTIFFHFRVVPSSSNCSHYSLWTPTKFEFILSKCWMLRKIAVDLDWPWIISFSQIRHSCQKISQNISKSLVCHRFKGVFYLTLSFYTLDLWPFQPWSAIESCDVADLISKRNKLWKRFRDSLKIRNISNLYLHCTEQPPQYWCYPPLYWCYPPLYWCYPPHVLMLCLHMYWCYASNVLNTLHSTEAIPHCTDVIPPLYWTTSTVLKVSPHSTEAIPHMYCCYPPTVLKVSLHSTEYPPQYWCYPPQYWCYPPQYWCYPPACTDVIPPLYWTTSTVLKLSPHSTEAIPPQYWSFPSLYWTTSTVLKLSPTVLMLSPRCTENLQCTEQPPQYWTDVIWGDSFVLMLRYCVNLKAIRYESTSLNRIVADKSHRVIVALKIPHCTASVI